MIDLVVRGGLVASQTDVHPASIAIDKGVIVAVGQDHAMPASRRTVDATDRLILPGLIDGHAHFCEDLDILAEPYETGTQAAAAGGVTTVITMPWDTPSLETMDVLDHRRRHIQGRAYIDYGLHAGISAHSYPDAATNLAALWDAGVCGVKLLMVSTDPHFPHLDDGQIVDVLRIMADLDALLVVHAENPDINRRNKERLLAEGRRDPMAHAEYRTPLSENDGVRRITQLASEVGARVVVAHMSTAQGVATVARARRDGASIDSEVLARNLWLSTVDLAERGSWVKTGPPVRDPAEVSALWPLLADGSVSIISSDHAPWTKEVRSRGESDIWVAYDGIPQIQETLPLLLDAVSRGRISITDVVRLTSYNPSRIFGLRPRKGLLQPGYDADLVLVDMNRKVVLSDSLAKTYVGYTTFEGLEVCGWPTMTMVRGETVMIENEIVGSPTHGEWIPRQSRPVTASGQLTAGSRLGG
nr:amidohydrolase family protein [Propionicimonas sp.]